MEGFFDTVAGLLVLLWGFLKWLWHVPGVASVVGVLLGFALVMAWIWLTEWHVKRIRDGR